MIAIPCPSEDQKLRFIARRVDVEEKARMETHLEDCDVCRREVAARWRQRLQASGSASKAGTRTSAAVPTESASAAVPAELRRRVDELVPFASGQSRPRLSLHQVRVLLPVAAILLVTVAALLLVSGRGSERDQLPIVRGEETSRSQELSPEHGAVVNLSSGILTFSWSPTPGALKYQLVILDRSGRRALEAEAIGERHRLDLVSLGKGDFYWTLTAVFADGTTKTRGSRSFRVLE